VLIWPIHTFDAATDGLTLVELLVALILVAAVTATASMLLMDGMSSATRASSSDTAITRSTELIEHLGTDLTSARSPERVPENVPTGDALRLWLLAPSATAQDNLYPEFDLRDITKATDKELWMRVDTIPEPANTVPRTECVGYQLQPNGEFFRIVYANWNPCPGSGQPLESTRMLEAPPTGGAPDHLFTYTTMRNTQPAKEPIDPNDCVTQSTYTPTQLDINRIIRMKIDLRSYVTNGQGGGSSKLVANLDVRSRLNRDYQYALGCTF
jgi:type II secretory pathway pseudopilin PulG